MNTKSLLLPLINFWPPFWFAGIKIIKRSKDYRYLKVKLKLRFWNRNYVGTQYGGSMFSMTDPFYMLMLIKNLGPEFVIWDKSAKINYLRPGKTNVYAEFVLSEKDLQDIRDIVKEQNRLSWVRKIEIKDENQEIVAVVEKEISIKAKAVR